MAPFDDAADLPETTLDPDDWASFRAEAHRMLDVMVDHLASLRERPVWRPMPGEVRRAFDAPAPSSPEPLEAIDGSFERLVLPYAAGNAHPRFLGWVHGGGTAVGMLAEMMAGGLNANLGGRDHAPVLVERQVIRWVRDLFDFPAGATGLFVTGSSMANFMAVIVAKTARLGRQTRERGLQGEKLVAYASTKAHSCVTRAMELSGLGSAALRLVPVGPDHRMRLEALGDMVREDRARGFLPFLVVGSAGTVDAGAIDDLAGLAGVASREGLWFHIDGAFGSLARLSPRLAPLLAGIERADSIALDFHKWLQAPYDAGFLLVRDGDAHAGAFATGASYLARSERGLSAGAPWFTDFGPDLSRGFRALKVWMTIKAFGTRRLGEVIDRTCRLAARLADRVEREPALELLAPVALNVVCFRYRHGDADRVNEQIVLELQEGGLAVPSTTRIDGALAIRVAIVNHRCRAADLDLLVDAILDAGARAR